MPRLTEAMTLAARQHAPFEATTTYAGGRFDDRRGGVAWLGLDDRQRRLRNLAREIDWRVGSNVYANSRPRPHVTIARRIDESLLADLHAVADELHARWTFDRVALYRSHADPGGSRYEVLAEQLLRRLWRLPRLGRVSRAVRHRTERGARRRGGRVAKRRCGPARIQALSQQLSGGTGPCRSVSRSTLDGSQ